jgi:RNA-directed DNA polymerase
VCPRAYVRYLDDGLLWARDKGELVAAAKVIRHYCADLLRLDLKQCIVNRVSGGVPFLGFLIKPHGIFLQRKSKRRMVRRAREITRALDNGSVSEEDAARRVTSIHAADNRNNNNGFRVVRP